MICSNNYFINYLYFYKKKIILSLHFKLRFKFYYAQKLLNNQKQVIKVKRLFLKERASPLEIGPFALAEVDSNP